MTSKMKGLHFFCPTLTTLPGAVGLVGTFADIHYPPCLVLVCSYSFGWPVPLCDSMFCVPLFWRIRFLIPKSDSKASCQNGAPTLSNITMMAHPTSVTTSPRRLAHHSLPVCLRQAGLQSLQLAGSSLFAASSTTPWSFLTSV